MFSNLNMELINTLNPLYAVPIIAVILCAFIVYAFGFKSPVPPPSFDGIEEEKKFIKKRKTKETQKSNKAQQNGKANGNMLNKPSTLPTKKKDEKLSKGNEKHSTVDKKSTKEIKHQAAKKHQEKKEASTQDDLNDDGWVQLVSKKGRKNQKREKVESQASGSPKTTEVVKHDAIMGVSDVVKDAVVQVEKSDNKSKEDTKENEDINIKEDVSIPEQITMPSAVVSKVEEKIPKKSTNESTAEVKSKKKKKNAIQIEPTGNKDEKTIEQTPSTDDAYPATASNSIGSLSGEITTEASKPGKNSNIAFDELAGLYPEVKEQKKKKKVRRDH